MKNQVKRLIATILLVVILAVCLSGCGKLPQGNVSEDSGKSIQVIDGAGRELSFAEPVKTVATSWGGGIDTFLYALGVSDRMVATNSKHEFDLMFFDRETMGKVGSWALDQEALAEILPELYLHGAAALEYLEQANEIGVASYGMRFSTFDDIEKNILDLGAIFGVDDRAAEIVAYGNSILQMIDERVSTIPESEKLTVVILGEQVGEIASDSYVAIEDMVKKAGGISCTPADIAGKDETTVVGLETIFSWNPRCIFLQEFQNELTIDGILNDPMWAPVQAVKDGKVFAIPSAIDSWCKGNPSSYLGTLFIAMSLYPDLFEGFDLDEFAVEYYSKMYNVTLTPEQIGLVYLPGSDD